MPAVPEASMARVARHVLHLTPSKGAAHTDLLGWCCRNLQRAAPSDERQGVHNHPHEANPGRLAVRP